MANHLDEDQVIDDEVRTVSDLENDKFNKPRAQRRLLSPVLPKKIQPIPTEEERTFYPRNRNLLSYAFFWWLNPIYKIGYRRTVEPEDLWKLNDEQKVETHYAEFEKIFNKKIANCEASGKSTEEIPVKIIIFSLIATFKYRLLASVLLCIGNEFTVVFIPMVNKKLIEFVERRNIDRSISMGPGVGYAICYAVMTLLAGMFFNHMFDIAMRAAIDIKSVLIKAALNKSIKLSAKGKHEFPEGKITSLIGNDLARIEYALTFITFVFGVVPATAVAVALLIVNIGPAALAGIGLLVVTCILQVLAAKKLVRFRGDANEFTDARVTHIREILNNFKVIKFYSWEDPYYDKVANIRDEEMKVAKKMKLITSIMTAISLGMPMLSTMLAFVVLYKLRGVGDVASIFSSLTLFGLMSEQIAFFPQLASSSADAYSALKRVCQLLSCDKEAPNCKSNDSNPDDKTAIKILKASFQWEKYELGEEKVSEDEEETIRARERDIEMEDLRSQISERGIDIPQELILQDHFQGFANLDISVQKNDFIVVTGAIGSGKTSLLNAIAGYMKKTHGTLEVNGDTILCGQPWIQNTTVRANITFGMPYDALKYKKVVEACALISDFNQLSSGDQTEIGERGITLSGGQKARISLARAVYADRDIILLDDVLSAVDAKVAHHIMKHCFLDLLKDKTRILATHQISLASACDKVIFIEKDGSVDVDTFESLKFSNPSFKKLANFDAVLDANKLSTDRNQDTEIEVVNVEKEAAGPALVEEEEKGVNQIGFDVYKHFLLKGAGKIGLGVIPLLISLIALTTFFQQFTSVWLTFWTEEKFDMSQSVYLGLYIAFGFLAAIFILVQLVVLTLLMNNASKNVIKQAVKRFLRAPMSFMDVTPMGRVLNRFTKDTEVLDNELFMNTLVLVYPLSYLCGVTVIIVVYLPWLAIAIPILFLIFVGIFDFSQATAREIKRMEATMRSFIFNNVNEVLSGAETIKQYRVENVFIEKHNAATNKNNEAYYLTVSCQRWLAVQLTAVSSVFGFLVAILAATGVFHLSASSTGLLLSLMLSFYGCLTMLFRNITMFEMSMNSVERLYEYSTKLEQESASEISETKPSPDWPVQASIEFKDVSMAYRPGLPLVLNSVNFRIEHGQRVGICGRTGAGKSSIMTALYRIAELTEGKICIDGTDISKLGLKDLRSRLSIIPQESVVFKGTVRYNLDPFGNCSDEQLWDALRKSGLCETRSVTSKFALDQNVEENGANFSLGERQLLALARALTVRSKILILDEATSSVDYETDNKIQTTIRTEFNNHTILCIAHRLKTILDYDKIIVLADGEVAEFDSPWNLYTKDNGVFKDMCNSANIHASDFN